MFKLEFKTDSAAFDPDWIALEAADVLNAVTNLVRDGERSGAVRDSNGNTIGHFELTED